MTATVAQYEAAYIVAANAAFAARFAPTGAELGKIARLAFTAWQTALRSPMSCTIRS